MVKTGTELTFTFGVNSDFELIYGNFVGEGWGILREKVSQTQPWYQNLKRLLCRSNSSARHTFCSPRCLMLQESL